MPPLAYLDECVDLRIIERLQGRGIMVRTARGDGMLAATDEQQFRYCITQTS